MAIRKTDKGYYAEVYLGVDPLTNKKIRKTKTFTKLKDAKDWEIDILKGYKDGTLNLKSNMLLGEYLDYWFTTIIEDKKSYNTVKRYKILLDCIKSNLGHLKLDKLKTPIVDKFYSDLSKETIILKDKTVKRRYMDGTILKVHRIFRQAMDKAVGWELVAKNVVDYAEVPQDDDREMDTWSIEEINIFIEIIKDTKIYLPVMIAFHTGLRQGEICALRWEDIDLKEGYLTVNNNIVEKKGGLSLESPKTKSSKSIVTLTEGITSILKEELNQHKKHKLKNQIDLEYVCRWEDGRPLRPTYISKTFTKYVDRTDLKKITFHGLRHSHATILYTAGANSQEISKRLRHSRVSTTDNIYIHVTEEIKKSTANIFDKAIDQIK